MAVDGEIYVVGGVHYTKYQVDPGDCGKKLIAMTSCCVYRRFINDGESKLKKNWSPQEQLIIARRRPSVVLIGNELICIGGSKGNKRYTSTVEALSLE